MIVGVVSDTHDNIPLTKKAAKLLVLQGVELVIHAGDIVAPFTLRAFASQGVKRLVAVYGNNCGERIGLRREAESLGYEVHEPPLVLELAGRRLLVMHGVGNRERTDRLAESLARSGDYDVVIYGHTHVPRVERIGGALLLNPGEVCGYLTGKSTVAVLDLAKLEARMITVAVLSEEQKV